jgi:hypothetical protein
MTDNHRGQAVLEERIRRLQRRELLQRRAAAGPASGHVISDPVLYDLVADIERLDAVLSESREAVAPDIVQLVADAAAAIAEAHALAGPLPDADNYGDGNIEDDDE